MPDKDAQLPEKEENGALCRRKDIMGIPEIIMLGLALSMDAFAVTISNAFAFPKLSRTRQASMPIAFGVFQFLMPLVGYLLGQLVSEIITQYAGIVTFVILGFIGGKMIWDAFHEDESEEEAPAKNTLTLPVLLFQAVATSIDALAVGVSFAALEVNMLLAVSLIGITTALTCTVALLIGKRFGHALGSKATIVGGVVLILIGLKSLIF